MILGEFNKILSVSKFVEGLQRASLGIIRFSQGDPTSGYCTAWLITDTLVIVPAFLVPDKTGSSESLYYCQLASNNNEQIQADPIPGLSTPSNKKDVRLLRLRKAMPERVQALNLDYKSLRVGEQIFVMQYPGGRPELKFSMGHLVNIEDQWLNYDADTEPGSGGGPIFNTNWTVIGIHTRNNSDRNINQGLSLASIINELRSLPEWSEIIQFHNIADVSAMRGELEKQSNLPTAPINKAQLAAVVRWNFVPEKTIPVEEQNQLKSHFVIDSSGKHYGLRANERQRIIRAAGSLETLRVARGKEEIDHPGQRVIDRILQGPPYYLEEVEDSLLPYWLQAVRWFAEVEPSLPTPAEVNRVLERRRVHSRLQAIAGNDFQGRKDELNQLQNWYLGDEVKPFIITGIGGVGKSALIAKFALGLPKNTLLLWLDFDRADLAPDDALSVLRLLSDQVMVQLDGLQLPNFDEVLQKTEEELEIALDKAVDEFGSALAKASVATLLVLDGFEIAQHVKQHRKIWQLLESILSQTPKIRIIVSGRAPVTDLVLHNRPANTLYLKGLSREDAKKWLQEHDMNDNFVLERVVDISDGIPLVLKLAVQLVATGDQIADIPQNLPKALVEGYLYQRILDRIVDPSLKDIAKDVLVLRSLNTQIISEVLADNIPDELDAQEVFSRLSQEMGLVRGDEVNSLSHAIILGEEVGVLRIRQEVRSATLKLLEIDNAARIHTINERAANWYSQQNLEIVENAAELVYHRLQLGDIPGAELVWRDECAPLLLYAEEDLPQEARAEREWLRNHTVNSSFFGSSLEAWEKEATERIRNVLERGLIHLVPEILKEREDRSAASPLILYDAWNKWQTKDLAGARAILASAGKASGIIERDRIVLGALLASLTGEQTNADKLLKQIEEPNRWAERQNGMLEALAVKSARIRLTVNLETELQLYSLIRDNNESSTIIGTLRQILSPSDVVLPDLCELIRESMIQESLYTPLTVPLNLSDLKDFSKQIQAENPVETKMFLFLKSIFRKAQKTQQQWSDDDLELSRLVTKLSRFIPNLSESMLKNMRLILEGPHEKKIITLGLHLARLGRRRWRFATTSLFLANACEIALKRQEVLDPLSLSVANTLAAFRGHKLGVRINEKYFPRLDSVLDATLHINRKNLQIFLSAPSKNQATLAKEILLQTKGNKETNKSLLLWLEEKSSGFSNGEIADITNFLLRVKEEEKRSILLYLLGPDPLEILCRRIIGLPDNLNM